MERNRRTKLTFNFRPQVQHDKERRESADNVQNRQNRERDGPEGSLRYVNKLYRGKAEA